MSGPVPRSYRADVIRAVEHLLSSCAVGVLGEIQDLPVFDVELRIQVQRAVLREALSPLSLAQQASR